MEMYYINFLIGTIGILFLLTLAVMFFGLKDPYIEQRSAIITQVDCDTNPKVCKVKISYTFNGDVYTDIFWMPSSNEPTIGNTILISLIPEDPTQYKLSWNTKINGLFVIGSAIIIIFMAIILAAAMSTPETESTA